jgi:large subunit ribosomal protein L35
MPKMKSKRAAKKRFRVTPGGKVVYVHSGLRHNLEKKPSKRRRRIAKPDALTGAAARVAKRLARG